nr:unnamed protein product [Digitaria exilis]
MASAPATAPAAGLGAGGGKDDELADLLRRLVDALARYADRLPFDLDRQLTLEQLVRHKLNEGRRVTCRLLGVILEETTPEELQNHVTVRPSVVEILLEIAKFCDVYLMEHVLDDESEAKVYQISTAHFPAATRKNSIQHFQLSKLGAIFWRPRSEMIRGQTLSSKAVLSET